MSTNEQQLMLQQATPEEVSVVDSKMYFIQRGDKYLLSSKENLILSDTLPAEVFTIGFNQMTNEYFLEKIDGFTLPTKLYGNTVSHAARIMTTFNSRKVSTGVLLTGEKGSGKSLLAKQIAINNLAQGNPAIVINAPWFGEKFNKFIQCIAQHATIVFDEFEKVYSENEAQEGILTLLDGVYGTKKLFVFTTNDQYKLGQFIRNRPGRIFYSIEYEGLDAAFIREYCEDRLLNKTYISTVCQIAATFSKFNFDMLQALVEEMNRYDESPQDAIKLLNAKPGGTDDYTYYDVSITIGNFTVPTDEIEPKMYRGSPITAAQIHIRREWQRLEKGQQGPASMVTDNTDSDDWNWHTDAFNLKPSDCISFNAEEGCIKYAAQWQGAPVVISFTRQKSYKFSYENFAAF